MREFSLKEIQQVTLETFIELDKICRKLNIHYFLAFGTLIGAIRHSGFIPWDDDIDVMILRKDYEILKNYMDSITEKSCPYKICDRNNTKNYSVSIPRFVNTNYQFISHYNYEKKFNLGSFVDLYILDDCGDTFEYGKFKLGRKIRKLNKLFIIYINPNNGKKNISTVIRYLLSFYLHVIWGNKFNFNKKVQQIVKSQKISDSKFVGVLYDCDPIERTKAMDLIEHEFEGVKVYIPRDYDAILNLTHKGYMTLPPVEERVPHHGYSIYLK